MTDSLPARPGETLLILGAGAVGCAAALTFARRGFKVTVVDRGAPGSGASHGNAGGIVPTPMVLAEPSLPWKVPGMLLDPTGPLTIRPGQLLRNLPWFLRFLAECRASCLAESEAAVYALSGHAPEAWRELVRGTPGANLLRDVGWLKAFSTQAGLNGYRAECDRMDRMGVPYERLDSDALRQMEPNLSRQFVGGIWHPDGMFSVNPRRLVEAIAAEARSLGTDFLKENATDLQIEPDGRVRLTTDAGTHRPDRIMLCAGAFSAGFARKLGARPFLAAERGYHAMFDAPERGLNRATMWVENSMVLCPMSHGTRLTTQSEFAGLDAPPDYTRLDRMVPKAAEMLPGLDTTVRERWMGRRPATPDSRPYLGLAPATDRAFLNFGHNHLGLTMAAVSARVAADAWTGVVDPFGDTLVPYRAVR